MHIVKSKLTSGKVYRNLTCTPSWHGRHTVHNHSIPSFVSALPILLFLSAIKGQQRHFWEKYRPPEYLCNTVQGYVPEGRLRVIQSSLALATNEEGALVKVEKVAISEWAWLMRAQQHTVVLTPSPCRLSPQRQAGRGSELTSGVIVTKCLTTVAKHSGLWVRVICVNMKNIGLLLPCIIWIQVMYKYEWSLTRWSCSQRNNAEFESINLLFHVLSFIILIILCCHREFWCPVV